MSNSSSRNKAIIIAYIALGTNMLSMLVLTPFYLKHLGINTYGLYQLIFSVAQYILMLEFGISMVMTRYILQYRIQNDRREEENFAMHCLLLVLGLCLLIVMAGWVVENSIENLFPNLTTGEITVAHSLFKWMIVQIVLIVLDQYFQGVALAYERYTIVKGIGLIRILLKTAIVILFIQFGMGVMGIVFADVLVMLLCCAMLLLYIKFVLNFKAKWHYFNRQVIKEATPLMFALLLQSIVTYANNAINMTILGRMMDTATVAIYAVAMTFISVYSAVPTTIQSVYLPQATKMVVKRVDNEQLTDLVIGPGRIQLILCMGMLCGFLLFGQQFISLWTGVKTLQAWDIALIIMVPMMIPLVQNVCLVVLTAKNRRTFRSVVLLGIMAVNILFTIVLVKQIGILGAPIGTALAYLAGNIVVMNIYYQKKIGFNIPRMFKEIFSGIFWCAIGTAIICVPMLLIPASGMVWFITECSIFCLVYALLLYGFGLNEKEKSAVMQIYRRYIHA
jgi:O-antigen/teichoic acid export membrane protein